MRFDPSKPWPEQYTPLKIEGKSPTGKQLKQYRKRGEKRGEQLTREAAPTVPGQPEAPAPEKGRKVTLDLEHPRVLGMLDEGERLIFEVPLISSHKDIPVDKFEVQDIVHKAARQVQHVSLCASANRSGSSWSPRSRQGKPAWILPWSIRNMARS